jgi:uncharacterized membrane protein YgcG
MSLTMYVVGLAVGAPVLGALASIAPPRNDALIGWVYVVTRWSSGDGFTPWTGTDSGASDCGDGGDGGDGGGCD